MTLFLPMQDIFNVLFISRFSNDQLGEDRIRVLIGAVDYIDINSFMFGINSDCAVGLVNVLIKAFIITDIIR